MIRKNVKRFSDKIMRKQKSKARIAVHPDLIALQYFPAPIYPNRKPATLRFWISSLPSVMR
jgi:hypothetical protein